MQNHTIRSITTDFGKESTVSNTDNTSPRSLLEQKTLKHDYYIKPVPPTYVTEYEAAYTWPESQLKANVAKGESKPVNQWQHLFETTQSLINKGFEPHLFMEVVHQVKERRLDSLLEYAYQHVQDIVKQQGVTVEVLPTDVLEFCKEFISGIDAIKSC